MRKIMVMALYAGVCCTIAFGAELLINGNFEEPYTVGWDSLLGKYQHSFEWKTSCDPDVDYEIYHINYAEGFSASAYLYQNVDVTKFKLDNITFSAKALFRTALVEGFCGSAVIIKFKSVNKQRLGDIKIFKDSTQLQISKWPVDSNQLLYEIFDNSWHTFSFTIGDELKKIPNIKQSEIAYIEVGVFDTCYWGSREECSPGKR